MEKSSFMLKKTQKIIIEERIAKLLDSKMKILSTVLDGTVADQDSLLSEIIKEYNK